MELTHQQFAEHLQKPGPAADRAAYLIHGEPILVGQCVEALIQNLLRGAPRSLHCEVLEGVAENIPELLERLNTYGWSGGPKLLWFKEARLFDSGASHQRHIEQIREALENEQLERAAKAFAGLCGRLGVEVGPAGQGQNPELEELQAAIGEEAIRRLADLCREQGWSADASDNHVQAMERAIEKGFPSGHFLILSTTSKVPRNRKFYKVFQSKGTIVDCHVPLGERRADKAAQEEVLRRILETALQRAGKRMSPPLFGALSQLTGFDPAAFRDNVEKLIDYAGERKEITAADVEAVVRRSKSDPLFELTNAVAERNAISSLFYLQTLLRSGLHPLQILAALANQTRKLLLAKDFTAGTPEGRSWRSGMAYPQFQNEVMPALQAYDRRIREQIGRWSTPESSEAAASDTAARRQGGELTLAATAGSAYPLYQTLLKSENYRRNELLRALETLNRADVRLKSSAVDPALLLKSVVMGICRKQEV